jgi:ATP-binding protein involved in chromosome partitioning
MEKTKKFLKNQIKGTKYAIMVSSAKGGVGKSTFAVNLAYSLQNLGKKIGLLDADVYGPSLTKLIGRNEKPKSEDGKFLHPIDHHGLQCISMGFLIEENTPMIHN